jgi:hypothetical protein
MRQEGRGSRAKQSKPETRFYALDPPPLCLVYRVHFGSTLFKPLSSIVENFNGERNTSMAYANEFISKILNELRTEEPISRLSKRYRVSERTIRRWRDSLCKKVKLDQRSRAKSKKAPHSKIVFKNTGRISHKKLTITVKIRLS